MTFCSLTAETEQNKQNDIILNYSCLWCFASGWWLVVVTCRQWWHYSVRYSPGRQMVTSKNWWWRRAIWLPMIGYCGVVKNVENNFWNYTSEVKIDEERDAVMLIWFLTNWTVLMFSLVLVVMKAITDDDQLFVSDGKRYEPNDYRIAGDAGWWKTVVMMTCKCRRDEGCCWTEPTISDGKTLPNIILVVWWTDDEQWPDLGRWWLVWWTVVNDAACSMPTMTSCSVLTVP